MIKKMMIAAALGLVFAGCQHSDSNNGTMHVEKKTTVKSMDSGGSEAVKTNITTKKVETN